MKNTSYYFQIYQMFSFYILDDPLLFFIIETKQLKIYYYTNLIKIIKLNFYK